MNSFTIGQTGLHVSRVRATPTFFKALRFSATLQLQTALRVLKVRFADHD